MIALSIFLDLSQIAAVGSISVLFVHAITHIGHLRKIRETGASYGLVAIAAIVCLVAIVLSIIYVSQESISVIVMLVGFFVSAIILEYVLQKTVKREIAIRVTC